MGSIPLVHAKPDKLKRFITIHDKMFEKELEENPNKYQFTFQKVTKAQFLQSRHDWFAKYGIFRLDSHDAAIKRTCSALNIPCTGFAVSRFLQGLPAARQN